MLRTRAIVLPAILLVSGCALEGDETELELDQTSVALSASAERARMVAIRDVAFGEGMTNGPLLAGIAQSETNLAHCWSEATWACKGPASPSCGGGPVIAGSGDGACSLRQGGLGLFQFDGGTHSQTLARDGEEILLLEGNIAHAVEFVANIIDEEVAGVSGRAAAIQWLNSVRLVAGDAKLEQWASIIVCRYNGCCSGSSTCTTRRRAYRDNALMHFNRYGADFWEGSGEADGCPAVPETGRTIDEDDACFEAAGPSTTWRSVDTGFEGDSLWTMTTDSANGANVGTWRLNFDRGGRYRVEVHLDGGVHGQSEQAVYQIAHDGRLREIIFDQTVGGAGFHVLGEFQFAEGGNQHIQLADNTGETERELLFDAIRLVPVALDEKADALGEDGEGEAMGGVIAGCAAGGRGTAGSFAAVLLVGLALLRRRRA